MGGVDPVTSNLLYSTSAPSMHRHHHHHHHHHTLLEKHTTDAHDYNEREQLKDKTKVTMVIYLDYNVKTLQLTKERLKTLRLHCGKT